MTDPTLRRESLTITADELGPMLKPTSKNPAAWLARHADRLARDHGMPRRLPGGWVWSRIAVMAWIGTYGATPAARTQAADTLIRQQQQQLMDAFAGRAA